MPTTAPPVGPVFASAGVAQAAYTAQIAWSTKVGGLFQIDKSVLGGTDVLGASSYSQNFAGTYDSLLANGLRLEEFQTTRGKADDLSQVQAGTATITVLDFNGLLNPKNPSSPLYALDVAGQSAVRPRRPGRLAMTYNGVRYPLYYGFVRTVEYDPGVRVGEAKIELVDLFSWLDTPRSDDQGASTLPVIPRQLNITTGGAVGLILDSIGWSDTAMRLLDVGDILPFFEATGDQTPLQLIADLMTANGGIFYIDSAGRAVFEDRNTKWLRASYAAIANTMQAITPSTSLDYITNIWNATRQYETVEGVAFLAEDGEVQFNAATLVDGPTQTAADAASRAEFGDLSQDVSSKYWLTDSMALGAAQWRLLQTKNPTTPIWNLQIDSREDNQMLAMAQAELLRRITVSEARTGTSGDYFIEQIAHSAARTDRKHHCNLILSERQAAQVPFRLDSDTIGGAATLGF